MQKILRGLLNFGAIYLIFDGSLHFFNIKILSVQNVWPESSVAYADLVNKLYASFAFLAAGIAFILQTDPKKYKAIIGLSAIWAIFHGVILLTLVRSQNYQLTFQNFPSLLVWLPFYGQYLTFNAILLFLYSGVVYFWFKVSS